MRYSNCLNQAHSNLDHAFFLRLKGSIPYSNEKKHLFFTQKIQLNQNFLNEPYSTLRRCQGKCREQDWKNVVENCVIYERDILLQNFKRKYEIFCNKLPFLLRKIPNFFSFSQLFFEFFIKPCKVLLNGILIYFYNILLRENYGILVLYLIRVEFKRKS